MSDDPQQEKMDISNQEISISSPSTSFVEDGEKEVGYEMPKKKQLKSNRLTYKIHQHSSMSANYSPE